MSTTRYTGSIRKMAKQLRKAGFTLEFTGGNHILITAPDGTTETLPTSPGNPSAQESFLRRAIQRGTFMDSARKVHANGR